MRDEELSKQENVISLREDLAALYQDTEFLQCNTMGELVAASLHMLVVQPVRKQHPWRCKIGMPESKLTGSASTHDARPAD